VELVPLEAIRDLSRRAEDLLSQRLNWEAGIQVSFYNFHERTLPFKLK
jgi:hypothetical protein